MTRKTYRGTALDVTFDLDVCQHAGVCLRMAPAAFDTGRKPWILPDAADAQAVRARAVELGGHATAFRAGDRAAGVFQPLAAPLAVVHRRLKQAFDPAGIFNPGRLYPEF